MYVVVLLVVMLVVVVNAVCGGDDCPADTTVDTATGADAAVSRLALLPPLVSRVMVPLTAELLEGPLPLMLLLLLPLLEVLPLMHLMVPLKMWHLGMPDKQGRCKVICSQEWMYREVTVSTVVTKRLGGYDSRLQYMMISVFLFSVVAETSLAGDSLCSQDPPSSC